MSKWTGFLLLILCSGMLSQNVTAAEEGLTVTVDGIPQGMTPSPVFMNDTVLVPMQGLFQALGAEAEWDESTGTLVGRREDRSITLQLNAQQASIAGLQTGPKASALRLMNNTPMVPARFVSESLGMFVSWDASSQTVQIQHDEPLYGRTKTQISKRMREARPSYTGDAFVERPAINSPQKQGKLSEGFIEDGVKMANFMRYLSGLPDDLIQSGRLNEQAQYGAVLLADWGRLSHTPGKPADMPDDFYKQGYASTSTSNIYKMFGTAKGVKTDGFLARTVHAYMRDEDDDNIAVVGHRRWILNPPLKEIGFGLAAGRETGGYKTLYSPMQVLDKSRDTKVAYETVTWPGKGYFPTDYFLGNDPWSISLNPEQFNKPDPEQVTVKLVRINDQTEWTLDRQDLELRQGEDYFNVDTSSYGIPYCIVFRPGHLPYYADGDRFEVSVSGLQDRQGNPAQLSYPVVFFDAE